MTYTGPIAETRSRPLRSLPEILKISQTFMLQTEQSDSNFHVTAEQILNVTAEQILKCYSRTNTDITSYKP